MNWKKQWQKATPKERKFTLYLFLVPLLTFPQIVLRRWYGSEHSLEHRSALAPLVAIEVLCMLWIFQRMSRLIPQLGWRRVHTMSFFVFACLFLFMAVLQLQLYLWIDFEVLPILLFSFFFTGIMAFFWNRTIKNSQKEPLK